MEQSELTATDLLLTNDFTVQVTLSGENLNPDDVSTILGIDPETIGRKGEERRVSEDGTVHNWEEGVWSHELSARESVDECRDHCLLSLVDQIAPSHARLKEVGVQRIYFYYTLASSIGMMNIRLRPETMRRLSEINADLYVTCFDCFDPKNEYWQG